MKFCVGIDRERAYIFYVKHSLCAGNSYTEHTATLITTCNVFESEINTESRFHRDYNVRPSAYETNTPVREKKAFHYIAFHSLDYISIEFFLSEVISVLFLVKFIIK